MSLGTYGQEEIPSWRLRPALTLPPSLPPTLTFLTMGFPSSTTCIVVVLIASPAFSNAGLVLSAKLSTAPDTRLGGREGGREGGRAGRRAL